MKFKLNPLTGEFDYTSESANKQKLNPLTGEFNLVEGDGPFSQIFNPLNGKFNLGTRGGGGIIAEVTGNGYINLTNAVANHLMELKAYGGTEQDLTPTPDNPVDIVCNNGTLKAIHQSGLPIGYTLLDYIKSGGNNYIDTGIKLTNEDVVEMQYLQTADKGAIYGEYYNGTANMSTTLYGNGTFYFYAYNAGGTATNVGNYDTNLHTVVHNFVDGYIDFDGVRTTFDLPDPNTFTNTLNCPIFGRSNGSSIGYFSKTQLYYFRIRRNGELILDLIPAKDSDNNVGMYDRVSGTLFTESGTGSFIAGNTVADPMTVYADGITETIGVKDSNNILPVNAEPDVLYPVNVASAGTWMASAKVNGGQELAACEIRYYNASKEQINYYTINNYDSDSGRMYRSFTVTTATRYVSISRKSAYNTTPVVDLKVETGSNMTPYYSGGTATAEMLLKINDYVDEQDIISGNITRKVGVLVLDGVTAGKMFSSAWNATYKRCNLTISDILISAAATEDAVCNFFPYSSSVNTSPTSLGFCTNNGYLLVSFIGMENITSANDANAFLAAKYNAGTPVIVLYPLATPTTESVAGQTMNIQAGNNTIEITQASIDNLPLYAKYLQSN